MKRRVLIGALICLAGLAAGFLYVRHTAVPQVPLTSNLKERAAFWKDRIDAVGPKRAYQEFAVDVEPLTPGERHENAHTFGGALFEAVGVTGLATCDARFSYGCFHEFLGRAIAELGLGVVNSLNQGCIDALGSSVLSCQHGIGHGIQAALGYDESALRKALDTCRSLPYIDPIGGCYGGVFMEYNMQTMLGEAGRTRALTSAGPLYPCTLLDSPYRPACAFWSPQWWIDLQHQAHGRDYVDTAAVGEQCDAFRETDLVRACYEGLGTVVAPEGDFVAARVRALCEESSTDMTRQLYCKSYAANSLAVGGAGEKGDAHAVCEGLSSTATNFCDAYARNEANIAGELPDFSE